MAISSRLINGFNRIIQKAGTQVVLTYYIQTLGSVYDEPTGLTKSGNSVWTSGLVLPFNPDSTTDALLMTQGKIAEGSVKLFTAGSLIFSYITGSVLQVKVGIGSPPSSMYSLVPLGGVPYEVEGIKVYKKVYLNSLPNGSLIGE